MGFSLSAISASGIERDFEQDFPDGGRALTCRWQHGEGIAARREAVGRTCVTIVGGLPSIRIQGEHRRRELTRARAPVESGIAEDVGNEIRPR